MDTSALRINQYQRWSEQQVNGSREFATQQFDDNTIKEYH
jgi:hypothetical protein